jgi:hypothetical protein
VAKNNSKVLAQAVVLTGAYVAQTFEATAGEDLLLFIDYTGGDETVGLLWKVEFQGVDQADTYHQLGVVSGVAWSEAADQTIATPGATNHVRIKVRIAAVSETVKVSWMRNGTSAALSGNVTISAIAAGARA